EAFRDCSYRGIVSLVGPSHAEEVVLRMLTSLAAVSDDVALAAEVQAAFSNDYLRDYVTDDVVGAEYGVAIKNVIALASGMLEGRGFGDNAKAALITRGLAETVRYGALKGGRRETFFGLTGVGDLIVTCFSPHSRNYQAGLLVGRADSAEALAGHTMTVEGIDSCREVAEDARRAGVEMPIVHAVFSVLFEGVAPSEAIRTLMRRPLREE
ncbi:MAG: NAD(P)H-dependent glycerol-3-phosphate dehydrogenase, partial [Clostridia bacterium]|nr:NAD(P)H-dependent glycerol-3-phosphate dehydrogenase [Clostridia bacterium]